MQENPPSELSPPTKHSPRSSPKILYSFQSPVNLVKMISRNFKSTAVIVILSIATIECGPKFDDGGFIPSSLTYLEKAAKAQDQIALPSQPEVRSEAPVKRGATDTNDISDRNQEPRFGFTNIGHTGTGYGVSPYAPAKIDLGGLLIGAIIGIGSILIIPKILYVLSGTYGSYARSEENGFAQTMTKLDDILARHGIDSTSCMQRAVCTYTQQAANAGREGSEASLDEKTSPFYKMLDGITTNQVFRTAMEGTAIQEAVEAGRGGRNCSRSYPHCGFSVETILSLLSNVVSTANSRSTTPPSGPAATL